MDRIGVIYGSIREGRLCDKVAAWVIDQTGRRFLVDPVDPKAIDWAAWRVGRKHPELAALRERLERADGFVVVTPEYNHSFPAPLKLLVDAFSAEWQAKPVAFVAYGGISGGLRAVEQLRLVFAELHATTIRDTVSLAQAWSRFDAEGRLIDPPEAAMAVLLERLAWWVEALKEARARRPYVEPGR